VNAVGEVAGLIGELYDFPASELRQMLKGVWNRCIGLNVFEPWVPKDLNRGNVPGRVRQKYFGII